MSSCLERYSCETASNAKSLDITFSKIPLIAIIACYKQGAKLREYVLSVTLTGEKEHNGFLLKKPFTHSGKTLVLTGRNGSGKTRLLESIQNKLTSVKLDGNKATANDFKLLDQGALQPNFGSTYSDSQFQTKVTSSLQLFESAKVEFDAPFNNSNASRWNRSQAGMDKGGIPYETLHRLCNSIAQNLGKSPSELTHDEIRIHFEDHVPTVLGFQNVSGICNQYIQRKNINDYNRYRAEEKKEDIAYITDDKFLERFGQKPWITLNKIIKSTFDSKFSFTVPDERSQSYSYNATLIQKDNGQPVRVEFLSSGEKTLLWLALTLFNTQYYDPKSVKIPKLLLLDEPDAFLHPKMVVKMYQAFDEFSSSFLSTVLFTTHSPSTVALAPEGSTYVVTQNDIVEVTKDEGVAELLDGVTQISISPENRRQVFVESQYDANTYQLILSHLMHKSDVIDPKISLNFVSSGPKMPEQQIKDKVKQVLGQFEESVLTEFVGLLNGVGNCDQVIGQVEALKQNNNETVRGVVDWDLTNTSSEYITVLSEGHAYSIENLALDPTCILLLLHTNNPESMAMNSICGSNVHWAAWLKNDSLLQESTDRFLANVLESENAKDATIHYVSGKSLQTDSRYLKMMGHPLEILVKKKYPALNAFARTGKEGELKYAIVSKSMITLANGKFIPSAFEKVFSAVQK